MTSALIAHLCFVPMAVTFGDNAGPNEHTLIDAFNTQAMSRLGNA